MMNQKTNINRRHRVRYEKTSTPKEKQSSLEKIIHIESCSTVNITYYNWKRNIRSKFCNR